MASARDVHEDSQNDRAKLNITVEQLDRRLCLVEKRTSDDHDVITAMAANLSFHTKNSDKRGDRMWAVALVIVGQLVSTFFAVYTMVKK